MSSFNDASMRQRTKQRQETVDGLLRSGRAPLHDEVLVVKKRIRSLHRGHLNPNGRFMKFWDCAIILALFTTIFITPVEVSFSASSNVLAAGYGIYTFNRCV